MRILRRLWHLIRRRHFDAELSEEWETDTSRCSPSARSPAGSSPGATVCPVETRQLSTSGSPRDFLPGRIRLDDAFALHALTLSTMGVYALTSYGVARRTQEIGVRVALGAHTHQVAWLFLRTTAVQLSIALTVGVVGAVATGRLLQAFLVGTGGRDPVTLTTVAGLLSVIALLASLLPAWRAARVDPMIALRGE
jgi:ABC-type antimicrobial peptide transport system permease subunit